MKTTILLISAFLLVGIGIGYWSGGGYWSESPLQEAPANEYHAMARDNNVLLEKIYKRVNQLEMKTVTRQSDGDCQTHARLLSSIQETIDNSLKNFSANSITTATMAVNKPPTPTEEQIKLYDTVKKRLYTYATSEQPIMEAMAEDPNIRKLTQVQQQQLATEIISRFNRGEITMDQIQGN